MYLYHSDNGKDAKAEQTKTKFAQVIDDLSGDIVKVNDAMKNLDFAGASDNAVDLFETKDGMIRRISNQLNKVIEMANVIETNNSIDMMNRTLTLLNTVFSICREIINANNEEEMTNFAVELYVACIKFTKATNGFARTTDLQTDWCYSSLIVKIRYFKKREDRQDSLFFI